MKGTIQNATSELPKVIRIFGPNTQGRSISESTNLGHSTGVGTVMAFSKPRTQQRKYSQEGVDKIIKTTVNYTLNFVKQAYDNALERRVKEISDRVDLRISKYKHQIKAQREYIKKLQAQLKERKVLQ